MDLLLVFIMTLVLITGASIWFKVSPFFTLVGGAVFFGLLAGMGLDATLKDIVSGAGKVFSSFGIIIFCGAVIAAFIRDQRQNEAIVSDIRRIIRSRPGLAGFSGWLLAVPVTCCVTAYVMLVPVLRCLGEEKRVQAVLLYLAAAGSIVSYILIYPTPAVIPLYLTFSAGTSAVLYNAIAIPLSLAVLGIILLFFRFTHPSAFTGGDAGFCTGESAGSMVDSTAAGGIHWRAWGPFLAILVALPLSILILGLSHVGIMNFVMLAGAVTAIALAPHAIRAKSATNGAKYAGVIIFDICGAGALGYVIVHSGFTEQALLQMALALPVILVPFIVAALIATAQGSRVTTAIIAAEVLAGSVVVGAMHPVTLILLIAAGTCFVSFVTDPFFWLVQRTTGDDIGTVVRNYTVPVALGGAVIFFVAVTLEYLVFTG